MKTWRDISGFFGYPSIFERAIKHSSDNSIFVEVGAWMGRSTCCMGELIKNSNKNIKFYSIDTWEGSVEHTNAIEELSNKNTSLFEQYKNNIKSCGVEDYVIPIQASSLEAVNQFEDESIDFLHIDASHDYQNVLDDISVWFPKVKPGGIISGDDYESVCWEGVVRAVNEYFKNKSLLLIGRDDFPLAKIWYHRKKSNRKNEMKITLYAISKNEEKNIQKFIENSKKFSHTVVVDTGSTDNTVQLLRDAGIEVYEHPQTKEEFDFSVVRNQALSYVKTEWAFSLDFNEDVDEFFPEGFDAIEKEFTTFKHLRFDDNGNDEPQQSNEVHVRFHRTKNYKWQNAVHEIPTFVPTEEHPEEISVDTTIKITKKINKSLSKELFYLDICEREHKKDQSNWYYIWFIFNHYFNVKNYTKALEYGQEYLNVSKAYFDTFRILVLIKCSICLFELKDAYKAANYAFHAVSEAMNIGEPYLSQAFSHLNQVSKVLDNPNITVFATAFNPHTLQSPERTSAIDRLFLTNIDDIPSCWSGHRKFAEWLVSYLKPEIVVDLGVDWGYSTFCFAMPRIGHVYGIDTFEGDYYTGNPGEHQYDAVLSKQEKLFMNNTVTFIKGYFDDVAKTWDKKIDILHIDGDHRYESVKNDFETWSKFLNDDAVILFHDTCVENLNNKDYGVKQFFEELDLPKCNFTHTFGLGVASKNKNLIELIQNNFDLSRPL